MLSSAPTLAPAPALVSPRPGLANGVAVAGVGSVYPGGKMAAFRSQCNDSDSDSDPPLVILDEVKMLGLQPSPEEEDFIQVDDDDEEEDETPTIKSINNVIKKKSVLNYDGLSYENTLSITPQDSQRDNLTPPLTSIPDVKTKLELNGGKNGVYESRVETPEERSPSPVLSDPEKQACNLSAEELRSIKLRNNNVRQLIYKEVKKPGRQHKELWDMLAKLHGPPWVRMQFILEVRQEAVRFKRRELAEELQSRSDSLSKLEVDR